MHVVLGSVCTGVILNLNVVHFHVVEIVFMTITVLFAFLTLRRKVGMISLLIQVFWIAIFAMSSGVVHPIPTLASKIALLIALIVAISLFGFLIIEFLQLRKMTEGKFVEINRNLTEVNHLVNSQSQEKTVMLKEIHHRVKTISRSSPVCFAYNHMKLRKKLLVCIFRMPSIASLLWH